MSEFLKILLSLSLSGTLLTLLLILLKKLYKTRFSKCWQYYIWLAAALRFLLPSASEHTLVNYLFQAAETSITDSMAMQFTPEAELAASADSTAPAADSDPALPSGSNSTLPAGSDTASLAGSDTALPADSNTAFSIKQNQTQPADHYTDTADGTANPSSLLFFHPRRISACIFWIWLIWAVWLFLHRIRVYRRFVHDIHTKGTAVSDIHIQNLLAACQSQCGVQKHVELYYHPQDASPVTTGFFHPCIAIPRSQISDTGLTFIFMHELTHCRRRDLFYKWLIQAVVCIHWFNPFVHLLEQEAARACELSCDEAVIRSLTKEEKTAYGDTLLQCSKINSVSRSHASSLTLTEGAKQLKERLGAIMNEQKRTKKTTAAAAVFTAVICCVSAMTGAYAVPANSASQPVPLSQNKQASDNPQDKTAPDTSSGSLVSGQNLYSTAPTDSLLPDSILSRYQSLLAFKTASYQNMTISDFRENAVFELDTPQGLRLLFEAAAEDSIRFYRFTDENAFFLCNILLPLTSETWTAVPVTSAGAERTLENGQTAELEFNASVKILNPDIKILEYNQIYSGLYQTAKDFLSAQTETVLANASVSSTQKIEKQARKALQKYAKAVSQNGNIKLSIGKCMYGPEDSAAYDKNPASDESAFAKTTSSDIPADVKKVLTLKINGYENFRLEDYLDYITLCFENDHSLWKAKERLSHEDLGQLKSQLSEEDYHFLTITLPCTQTESVNPYDRVGNIPPDFGRRFELPYPKYRTRVSFEWTVRYEPSDPDLTIGQRDQIIKNILHGMDAFVADTSKDADVGSMRYLKKMRRYLEQLLMKNSGRGLDMNVFQCMSDGKSA